MTVPANPQPRVDDVSQDLDAISERLVAARTNAEALRDFPGLLPETLEDAYAIQTASIRRWPDAIGGWKVGMVPDAYRETLAAQRLTGPIFDSSIFGIKPDSSRTMPIFDRGFAAVEAEFVLQLAATVEPVEREYSDDELVALVAALHVGAEIASSPMADVNNLGPCCVVSDFGNNSGLLVGPAVPNWSDLSPESLAAAVIVDGDVVGTAAADAIEGGLLQALRFLIGLCANRQLSLAAGTYVSCGAVTGIHEVTIESEARIDFGPFGLFDVAFEPMSPQPPHGSPAKV